MRRYRTTAKQLLFLLVALVTVLMPGRSSIKSDSPKSTTAEPTADTRRNSSIDNAPTDRANVRCLGIGLAAVDLAGNCRATPQATMGALEAADK